jgi:hypothetical protein
MNPASARMQITPMRGTGCRQTRNVIVTGLTFCIMKTITRIKRTTKAKTRIAMINLLV